LVDYGFRLPLLLITALNFHEFDSLLNQTIFVSATPGEYELEKTGGIVVEQVVRQPAYWSHLLRFARA